MLFFFGVYYDFLISISDIFKPLDELFYLFLIPYIFINYKWFGKIPRLRWVQVSLLLLLTFGFLGFFKFKYQSILVSLMGGLVYFKSFIPYFFILFFLDKNNLHLDKLYNSIQTNFVFSLVIIILGIGFQFVFAPWSIYWKGPFPQLVSIFRPDTSYGFVMSFLGLVFFYMHRHKKQSKILFWILILLIVVSFRVKALFFTGIVVLFMYSKKNLLNIRALLIVPVAVLFFSIKPVRNLIFLKFSDSFTSKTTYGDIAARAALTFTSYDVAADHFPLGSGFATYGTHFSGVHYSPLYRKYGLSKVYGLTKKDHSYINDTQWPPILAETGVLGLISFLLILYGMYNISIQNSDNDVQGKRMALLCFMLLLINSSGAPVFFNASSAAIYSLIAIISNRNDLIFQIDKDVKD